MVVKLQQTAHGYTCMKAGVVGSNRKLGTRTEECVELESTGARTYKNPRRESIGVSVSSLNFSFNIPNISRTYQNIKMKIGSQTFYGAKSTRKGSFKSLF